MALVTSCRKSCPSRSAIMETGALALTQQISNSTPIPRIPQFLP